MPFKTFEPGRQNLFFDQPVIEDAALESIRRSGQAIAQDIRWQLERKPSRGSDQKLAGLVQEFERSDAPVREKMGVLSQVVARGARHPKTLKASLAEGERALVAQIRYLSQKDTGSSVQQKVEALLDLPAAVALRPEVMKAVGLSYQEQAAYSQQVGADVWEAGRWARDYKEYTFAGAGFGPAEIRYDPPPSNLITEQYAQDQKRDDSMLPKGDTVPAEQLPKTMVRMARRYFQAQFSAALAMEKSRNSDIRLLARKLGEDAQARLHELNGLGESPADRRGALRSLVEYEHDHLQPALGKMEQAKYFDELYALAQGSAWKTGLVWMKEHGETGMLWSAITMGALNPLAGRMAFTLMGTRQAVQGAESGNWSEAFMGACMVTGMLSGGLAGRLAAAGVTGEAARGMASQISSGLATGFTSRDVEGLANNLALLEGYFKSRAGMSSELAETKIVRKSARRTPAPETPGPDIGKAEKGPGPDETKAGRTAEAEDSAVSKAAGKKAPGAAELGQQQQEEMVILHDAKNAVVRCDNPTQGLLAYLDEFPPSAERTALEGELKALRADILKISDGFDALTRLAGARERNALGADLKGRSAAVQTRIGQATRQVDALLAAQPPSDADAAADIGIFNTALRNNSGDLQGALVELQALAEGGIHQPDVGKYNAIGACKNYFNAASRSYGKFAGQGL
ncbi:MAG: hypothetical protein KGH63_03990, partial [Candidatus Micrarchaeota archaeon]|nr:hypothetical protein [Candidatus Micrarchaeota archaeon]